MCQESDILNGIADIPALCIKKTPASQEWERTPFLLLPQRQVLSMLLKALTR